MAIKKLIDAGELTESPIKEPLAAISVGINTDGKVIADLNYEEDSSCETDMNVVMTKGGRFIEIQGTAEGEPFTREQLNAILEVSEHALVSVFTEQEKALC